MNSNASVMKSRIFPNAHGIRKNVSRSADRLFKHFDVKQKFCSNILGAKQDFCPNIYGAKQDYCSTIMEAKLDFCTNVCGAK